MGGQMDHKLRPGRDLGDKSDEFTLEMLVLWCHWINGWWPCPRSQRTYEPREKKSCQTESIEFSYLLCLPEPQCSLLQKNS